MSSIGSGSSQGAASDSSSGIPSPRYDANDELVATAAATSIGRLRALSNTSSASETSAAAPPPPRRRTRDASKNSGQSPPVHTKSESKQSASRSGSLSSNNSGRGRLTSLSSLAQKVIDNQKETRMSRFCSTVRSSILNVKTRSIKVETSFLAWLDAFVAMEREYVDGITHIINLADNFKSAKYKPRVGRKVRKSRFAQQSAPIVGKIIALHEEHLAQIEAIDKNDTIAAVATALEKYNETLKQLIWLQIPYANAYPPSIVALQRFAERSEVSKSTTLRTNLALAMSTLAGPVSYAGRSYAFFTKFFEATQTQSLSFTGDVAMIASVSDKLLPSILETLEDMATKCTTTALEGHLDQLLRRFPGLGLFVEDQELLNYGRCTVGDAVSPQHGGNRGGAKKKSGKRSAGTSDYSHEGEAELFLFSRMVIKVSVSSVHNVSLLHGILLERDDLCLTPNGTYDVEATAPGQPGRPKSTKHEASHLSHVVNLGEMFQINFGPEYVQIASDDLVGRSVSVITREDRKQCRWKVKPVQSLGTIKPLHRIIKHLEDGDLSPSSISKNLKTQDVVNSSSTYSGEEEIAEWHECLRLCVDFQKTREEEQAKLMVACQQGDVETVRHLIENGVSPNGRALLKQDSGSSGPKMSSALEVALKHQCYEIAAILLAGHANIFRKSSEDDHSLAAKLYFEDASLLQEYQKKCTPSEEDALQKFLGAEIIGMAGISSGPSSNAARRPSAAHAKKKPARRRSSLGAPKKPKQPEEDDESNCRPTFHFGQPLRLCQSERVDGYGAPIPSVLVYLKEAWLAAEGQRDEGVFRVACDAKRSDAIENFFFRTCLVSLSGLKDFAPDAFTNSALPSRIVKRFFRAMPEGGLIPLAELVAAFPALAVNTSINIDDISEMLTFLEPRRYWLFLWLLDWLAIVASNEEETRMNPNNLAIVLGPNLYEQKPGQSVDPTMAIKYSKIINEFTKTALEWRMSAASK